MQDSAVDWVTCPGDAVESGAMAPKRRLDLSARAADFVEEWERFANPRQSVPREQQDKVFRMVELKRGETLSYGNIQILDWSVNYTNFRTHIHFKVAGKQSTLKITFLHNPDFQRCQKTTLNIWIDARSRFSMLQPRENTVFDIL